MSVSRIGVAFFPFQFWTEVFGLDSEGTLVPLHAKNVAINNNQNSNLSVNNKNTGLVFNTQNPINNTKSNLYSKPSDIFSQYMLDQINKIRTNPRSYVDLFKKARDNIKQDKRGNLYYSGKIKVALYKGKEAFDDAISSLEKTKPMKPLIFKKELCIELSNDKCFLMTYVSGQDKYYYFQFNLIQNYLDIIGKYLSDDENMHFIPLFPVNHTIMSPGLCTNFLLKQSKKEKKILIRY